MLLGTITAVGSGALRDLLLNRIPSIFGGAPLCATVRGAGERGPGGLQPARRAYRRHSGRSRRRRVRPAGRAHLGLGTAGQPRLEDGDATGSGS
ncbi:TRIC cation channel family protein [Streptomyces sp. NBC_00631]|uniref:TRIC cation channel family protein n=1 Tax=Streptomyces sp. NBC_00631 TaxID=2975793 RepID=UPI0030E0C850